MNRDVFREAMASFPAGVTIVTTTDAEGAWHGFTATSFCSVSMEPPLISVCLARTANCHDVFATAERWAVHVLRSEDSTLATLFATRGADKFAGDRFTLDQEGLPALDRSVARLVCRSRAGHPAGDHTILLGQVERVTVGAADPVVYHRRGFHALRSAREVATCTS